jgi:hypothetical protein
MTDKVAPDPRAPQPPRVTTVDMAAEDSSDDDTTSGKPAANPPSLKQPPPNSTVTMTPAIPSFAPTSSTPGGFLASVCDRYCIAQGEEAGSMLSVALEMIQFTEQLQQAKTLADILPSLECNYTVETPDPGIFLGQSNGQLVLLYGLTKCPQTGTPWYQQLFAFVGDLPTPTTRLPPVVLLSTELQLTAPLYTIPNITSIRDTAKLTVQGVIHPKYPSDKKPVKAVNAVSLVRLPPALLVTALKAGNPQTHPVSFLKPIIERVKKWTEDSSALFPNLATAHDTLLTIGNSLKGFVTAPTTASVASTTGMVTGNTGAAALNLHLQLVAQPDPRSTTWASRHLEQVTGWPWSMLPNLGEAPPLAPPMATHGPEGAPPLAPPNPPGQPHRGTDSLATPSGWPAPMGPGGAPPLAPPNPPVQPHRGTDFMATPSGWPAPLGPGEAPPLAPPNI